MLKLKILNNEKPINLKYNISFPDVVKSSLQEKEIIPTKEVQEVVADSNFDGLSKVTVNAIPEDYVIPTGEIDITENGTYDVKEKVSANVNVPGYDTSDATATAGDIASGKTAYISSGLVEGTGTISTPVTKGLVINSYDADGYPTDISIVGLTEIPSYYFYYAIQRTTVFSRVGANIHFGDAITSIGNNAFQQCQTLTINSLPSGIVNIGDSAFRNCTAITEMTLYGDIDEIKSYAFQSTKIAKLVLPNVTKVPTLLNTNVFTNTPIASGTGYIYVPDSLVASFKSATNWSTYANQIKGVSEL